MTNNSLDDFAPNSQLSTQTMLKQNENFRDILWTTDIKRELPVFLSEKGLGSLPTLTIIDMFEEVYKESPKECALFFERYGQWNGWTWNHYHKEVVAFALALISIGIEPYKTVNILGFNSPEWFSAFIGGIYACVIPTGIYPTNNSETCVYIAEHSECACLVLDSVTQFRKYEKHLHKLKNLKAIVFYCDLRDKDLKAMLNPYVPIYLWKDFIEIGKKSTVDLEFKNRIKIQKPGNCCNIVYTSGTTGHPKAVLLSHDNLTWTVRATKAQTAHLTGDKNRHVSYLPLSHIAGQLNDIIMPIFTRSAVYFGRPDALAGSLVKTLKFVRPTVFFSVPRMYEKFEEKIRESFLNAGFIKKKILKLAHKTGLKYADNVSKHKSKPLLYPLVNVIVFNKIKKALGLEKAKIFAYGAAPMKKETIEFFKSIGIILYNTYGMSECTGPQFTNMHGNPIEYHSAGKAIHGTTYKVSNPDTHGIGEICFRGRNRFMGYFKDETATLDAIDSEGFLHSGDQGFINQNGNLFITGRLKELIVTAGGENVAPLPIEESLIQQCKILSNIVILGDDKKYLSALLTLKTDQEGNLTKEVVNIFKTLGSDATHVIDAINSEKVRFYIQKSVDEVNKKAVSRAQLIRKWTILPNEFSVNGGELTPTLKVKRKFVSQKYAKIIDKMYQDPKF